MITTIDVHSASYPIHGAARGSGVDYELALHYVAAADIYAARDVQAKIIARHGAGDFVKFYDLIQRAVAEHRLVVRRWRRG